MAASNALNIGCIDSLGMKLSVAYWNYNEDNDIQFFSLKNVHNLSEICWTQNESNAHL